MKEELPQCITASIDLTDEFEVSLVKHVISKGNRSKYLKRLIYNDMIGVKQMVTTTVYEDEEEDDDIEAIEGFF
jgi:hypothetical protein